MLVDLDGKVALVTGGGQGIGRAHCLELGRRGARVVVNDVGPSADEVAAEVRDAGGEAIAHRGDVADFAGAKKMIELAVDTWGSFDVLVNNAGVIRDRMLFNMDEDDFDLVVRVHLKGHFCTSRWAASYWRDQAKEQGGAVYGRVINTTSEAGMIGSPGQPNYSPAKAGVIQLTLATAQTLAKYGVTANAIAPRAKTAMTASMGPGFDAKEGEFEVFAPSNISPLVAYLASPAAARVNGQVLVVWGKQIQVIAGPRVDRSFDATDPWTPDSVAEVLGPFYEGRTPITDGFVMRF